MFDWLIGIGVVAVAVVVAWFRGRGKGAESERTKQAKAYQERREKIDAAGNDVGGIDRDELDRRLRKHAE